MQDGQSAGVYAEPRVCARGGGAGAVLVLEPSGAVPSGADAAAGTMRGGRGPTGVASRGKEMSS